MSNLTVDNQSPIASTTMPNTEKTSANKNDIAEFEKSMNQGNSNQIIQEKNLFANQNIKQNSDTQTPNNFEKLEQFANKLETNKQTNLEQATTKFTDGKQNQPSQLDQLASKLTDNKQATTTDQSQQVEKFTTTVKQEDIKPSPDSLLSSLFSNNLMTDKTVTTTQATSPSSSTNMTELVDKLVDRILVADTKNGTEVRINLNDGTMAGTEIKLIRSNDGQLTVHISSDNSNSFQSLVAAQDSLKQALAKTDENVRVEISDSSNEQNDANNPNQRSQGYTEYQQEE